MVARAHTAMPEGMGQGVVGDTTESVSVEGIAALHVHPAATAAGFGWWAPNAAPDAKRAKSCIVNVLCRKRQTFLQRSNNFRGYCMRIMLSTDDAIIGTTEVDAD